MVILDQVASLEKFSDLYFQKLIPQIEQQSLFFSVFKVGIFEPLEEENSFDFALLTLSPQNGNVNIKISIVVNSTKCQK